MKAHQLISFADQRAQQLDEVWKGMLDTLSSLEIVQVSDNTFELNWLSYTFIADKRTVVYENSLAYKVTLTTQVAGNDYSLYFIMEDDGRVTFPNYLENRPIYPTSVGPEQLKSTLKRILADFLLNSPFFEHAH